MAFRHVLIMLGAADCRPCVCKGRNVVLGEYILCRETLPLGFAGSTLETRKKHNPAEAGLIM